MSIPVVLRPDYDAVRLRHLAHQSKGALWTRRLLALAGIYEDGFVPKRSRLAGLVY